MQPPLAAAAMVASNSGSGGSGDGGSNSGSNSNSGGSGDGVGGSNIGSGAAAAKDPALPRAPHRGAAVVVDKQAGHVKASCQLGACGVQGGLQMAGPRGGQGGSGWHAVGGSNRGGGGGGGGGGPPQGYF